MMNIEKDLDDLLKSFELASVPSGEDAEAACSDAVRWCQYKRHQGGRSEEAQSQRRERVLREQNRSRSSKLAEMRQSACSKGASADDVVKDGNSEASTHSPRSRQPRHLRYGDDADLLKPMFSEWMLAVPDDLANDWLLMFCPVGRRNMVVANGGMTRVYSKAGKRVMEFASSLPSVGDSTTVIDCIFSQADLTFYVLDLLVWNGTSLCETETECRQYFLHSRFAENPKLSESGIHNSGYRFVIVPVIDNCGPEAVAMALAKQPQKPVIDGLLFYHKRCHYTHGITPTVLWLRPFMLPTTLGVSLPAHDKQEQSFAQEQVMEK